MGKCCEDLAVRVGKLEEQVKLLAKGLGLNSRAGLIVVKALKDNGIDVVDVMDTTKVH